MISFIKNQHQIGIYGFAVSATAFFKNYTNIVSDLISPKIGFLFGSSKDSEKKINMLTKQMFIYNLLLFTFFMPLFILGVRWLIENYIPKFNESYQILRNLIVGAFFVSMYIPFGNLIVLLKKNWIFNIIAFINLSFFLFQ